MRYNFTLAPLAVLDWNNQHLSKDLTRSNTCDISNTMQIQFSTVTQKGQVTIPVSMREKFGLKRGNRLFFSMEKDHIKVYTSPDFFSFRGALSSKKPFDIKKMRKSVGKQLVKRYAKSS